MKKIKGLIIVILISISCFLPTTVFAYNKEDIFALANSQRFCDAYTNIIFNSYKNVFTRLIKEKDLKQSEIDKIYNNVQNIIRVITSNGVCSKDDLSKLTDSEKNYIKNLLTDSANTINNSTGNTGVIIDKDSITIVDKGTTTDKIELNSNKLNYVGINTYIYTCLLILGVIMVLTAGILVKLRKEENRTGFKIYKSIFKSLLISSFCLFVFIICFIGKIDTALTYLTLINVEDTAVIEKEVVMNEKGEIISYPNYGNKYGILKIARLNLDIGIFFGDSKSILKLGVGNSTTSHLPGEGENIILSGHNTKNYLYKLRDIKKSDLIVIETSYGTYSYNVDKYEVIDDTSYDKLYPTSDKETLILYTCYPFDQVLYSNKRLVIYASLQEGVKK